MAASNAYSTGCGASGPSSSAERLAFSSSIQTMALRRAVAGHERRTGIAEHQRLLRAVDAQVGGLSGFRDHFEPHDRRRNADR